MTAVADKDEFVSVLEQGDMASPRYRAQLAKQQELENVYPETWGLGALGRTVADTGARVARGLRGVIAPSSKSLSGHVVSPRMDELLYALKGPAADTSGVARSMDSARTMPALMSLPAESRLAYFKTGKLPDNWDEVVRNTSAIGAHFGTRKAYDYTPHAVTTRDRFLNMYEPVEKAAGQRMLYFDAPMAAARLMDQKSSGAGASGLRSPRPGSTAEYMPAPEAASPKWNWQQEQQFRKDITGHPWYKEFQARRGEAPDLNSKDYNYRAAYAAGVRPERYAPDNNAYHWPSTTPGGQSLKARNHPTGWMEDYMQITGGRDPHEGYQMTPAQAATLGKSLRYRYGGQ